MTTITERNLAAWLATPRPWAMLPQTFAIIGELAAGRITVAEAAEQGTERADEREPAAGAPGVALIPLRGVITPRGSFMDEVCGTSGGLAAFAARLDAAVEDPEVGAILLDVDSPGGTTDLVPETAAMIREAAAEKPVVASANAMAASAAYWLASQATEVVATPSAVVGSIGVYTRHVDVSEAEDRVGIRTTLVSAGRYKVEGNPHEPLSPEARAHLQAIVDDVYDDFVEDVARGRGTSASAVRAGYGQGRVLTARRALSAGLIDRVEPLHATIGRLLGSAEPAPVPVAEPAEAQAHEDPEIESSAAGADERPAADAAADAESASRLVRERLAALL